jgi:uncharacterized membrane protein YeaQ/YmgE (transglycosylase-associated protein family)
MSILELIILLLIAGICGSVAQALVGFSRGGCILSVAVGFIGALIGSWLAGKFGFPEFFVLEIGGTSFPVIWSIIGAVIFVGIISLLTPRRPI